MTLTLIPRAGGAKVVATTDFEKYWDPVIQDYLRCGLTIAAQCPNILGINLAAGDGRINGLYVENTATLAVNCLTACTTNFIIGGLTRDVCCRPTAFVITSNVACCVTADQMLIASAVTNCMTVTSVDNSLADLFPFAHVNKSICFGNGKDGSATNPTLVGPEYREYTCLTINVNRSWGGTGPIFVKVSGTLTICCGDTLTIQNGGCGCAEGKGSIISGAANGGDGRFSRGTFTIMAKTITGAGTLLAGTPGNANGGAGIVNCGTDVAPCCASTDSPVAGFINFDSHVSRRGMCGSRGGCDIYAGGTAPEEFHNACSLDSIARLTRTHATGGAGGGNGVEQVAGGCNVDLSGGSGGAGGSAAIAPGGNGGSGGLTIDCNAAQKSMAGAGGGGGSPSLMVIVTENMGMCFNVTAIGGNGGAGGSATANACWGGGGAGGGGAGVGLITIADANNACVTLTAGTGGAVGASGGGACRPCNIPTTATAGVNGTTKHIFINICTFRQIYT